MIYRRWVELYTHCRTAKTIDADNQVTSWADYEEEDLHKPLPVSTGSAGFYLDQDTLVHQYDSFTPRKGREWSEMEVNVDYSEFTGLTAFGKTPRFIRLVVDSTDGTNYNSMNVYGWIDDISPIATKGPKSNTLIRWHVDYWLTIADALDKKNLDPTLWADWNVAFGQGRIRRGPVELARPDPSSPRMWVRDTTFKLNFVRTGDTYVEPYAIVHYTTKVISGANEYTQFKTAFWQINGDSLVIGGVTYSLISMDEIYSGKVEELMEIAASSIIGIYFSPVPPVDPSSVSAEHSTNKGWYAYDSGAVSPTRFTMPVPGNEIVTTDAEKYIVIDPFDTVQGVIPWGLEVNEIVMWLDIGTSGAWLNLEFKKTLHRGEGEGRVVQMPLISAPVTSNALSDYVYSGQREYDMEMARIQQDQNLKSGVAGLGTSLLGGVIGGAMVGGPAGAVGGAIAGTAVGGIGVAANYMIQGESNAKAQAAVDRLMSNQISNVIIAGGSRSWYYSYSSNGWCLIKLVRDDVSAAELSAEQSELGYVTDTYSPDCNTFILTGGPMRIEGLQVRGDVNREGKAYLRALFERGVNIDVITLNWS